MSVTALGLKINGLVFLLFGNHPTHTAAWVVHIAISSWDQMDMDVKHSLPRGRTGINPNIKTRNCWVLGEQFFTAIVQEPFDGIPL